MYALCCENGVKIFDEQGQILFLSQDDFLSCSKNYQIILDLRNVDFSLEKLINCSFFDAHRILHYKRKAMSADEATFLIPSNRWNFFKKGTFYIQKISIKNCDFFHKLPSEDGMFLMENIVAEFCESVTRIDAETWWLYAVEHELQNSRIIAGIGRGVIFSRFLFQRSDVREEVFKTIAYLKRFGLGKTIKIITTLSEIDTLPYKNISFEIFKLEEHEESSLINFLSSRKRIKKIFAHKNWLMQLFDMKQFYYCAFLISFILASIFFMLCREICAKEEEIMQLKKTVAVEAKNLHLKINVDNFPFLRQFVDILRNSSNPLDGFELISQFCHKNRIRVEQLSMENCNSVQIKTLLNKKKFEKIQKYRGKRLEISTKKLSTEGNEYEELETDKEFGALLCIKIK
ncbi:MAG: hypothetical protein LBJ45_01390 [Holosporaceae bacterium]|jgi:hypothetical protein|nr:hypothetical protein [Holosporaceae bacterium]